MSKYKGKYRTTTTRLPSWNYGWNAQYFVTLCTKDKHHFFGQVRQGQMHLSDIGTIAHQCWLSIPNHFPFVRLHPHIIMPNHVHGIIEIAKQNDDLTTAVETQNFVSKDNARAKKQNQFGPQSQNLAAIIRGFKVGVTKNARKISPNFSWQAKYHDHLIRSDKAYGTIADYIQHNPLKWSEDCYYSK